MNKPDFAIMYHYVRDDPRFKAMRVREFERQTSALQQEGYSFATAEEVFQENRRPRCFVTFDDGLKDVYTNAFPILKKLGVRATVFVPTTVLVEKRVLLAHKLHYLLASLGEEKTIEKYNELAPGEVQVSERGGAINEFDSRLINNLKYLVNNYSEAADAVGRLYASFFDEGSVFQELYLSEAELLSLKEAGWCVGGHGHGHLWLGRVTLQEQSDDLALMKKQLLQRGFSLTFSYPYVSHDLVTARLAEKAGFDSAWSVGNKPLDYGKKYELNRVDCINLEKLGLLK